MRKPWPRRHSRRGRDASNLLRIAAILSTWTQFSSDFDSPTPVLPTREEGTRNTPPLWRLLKKGLPRPKNKDLRHEFDREIRTYVDGSNFLSSFPFARGGKGSLPPLAEGGGERDRSLATSFHRAQQKHGSRNRPSNSVNTNFSPAQGRGGGRKAKRDRAWTLSAGPGAAPSSGPGKFAPAGSAGSGRAGPPAARAGRPSRRAGRPGRRAGRPGRRAGRPGRARSR